jgi:hypothetical protein
MNHWKTTDVGPETVKRGTGSLVHQAATQVLVERNGGLPPNLHMKNRAFLLKVIKQLHEENQRLRLLG